MTRRLVKEIILGMAGALAVLLFAYGLSVSVAAETLLDSSHRPSIGGEEPVERLIALGPITDDTFSTVAVRIDLPDKGPDTLLASLSEVDTAAKEIIAFKESGGSYTAQNGQYYGRYQLTLSYLNGDLSPENQERVADAYVAGRYGTWSAALAFWQAHGWY